MKPNKAALEFKKRDREGLKDIFRIARQTDVDKGWVREHIEKQSMRGYYKTIIEGTLIGAVTGAGLSTLIYSHPYQDPLEYFNFALAPIIMGALYGLGIGANAHSIKIDESNKNYRALIEDAKRNYPAFREQNNIA